MKYLFLLIISIFLCSCSSSSSSHIDVQVYEYDGHSYLIFDSGFEYGFDVIHNPNCSCKF